MPRGVEQGDDGSTRIARGMLATTLASAALLVLAAAIGEPESARGGAHPQIPGMQHGGDPASRVGPILWVGGAFGLVQIVFFGLCFALGMRRSEGLGPVLRPLALGLVLYGLTFIALMVSYASYTADPAGAARWLGFPLPTAIMLFGFWPLPVIFALLYVRHFDWMLDEARLERFRARLSAIERDAGDR